jgi:integrase
MIGDMRLSDVRPRHVQQVVDSLIAGRRGTPKPATVHRQYRMLKAALGDAVRSDRLAVSPCRGIDLPKLTSTRLQPPTPEQVGRILDAAVDPYRVPLALCALGGLRRGEALALRWSDLDESMSVLYVRQAATFVGREVSFDRPKSRDGERAVPMPLRLVEVLRAAKREQAERRLAVGAGWVDADLIADSGAGAAMHPERLSRYFRLLVRRLRIPARLHDLRHAAVTAQLAGGVPLAIVSAVAGHSSTSFTARQYGHLRPEDLHEVAAAMEAAFRR